MKDTTSREQILKKVRAALIHKSRLENPSIDFESSIYPEPAEALELVFAQQFSEVGGQFIFCENEEDFCYNVHALTTDGSFGQIWCGEKELQELLNRAKVSFISSPQEVEKADTSITACEFLVARTGSILVSSMQGSGRRAPVFPHQHIVVAKTSQLIYDMKEALKAIKAKYPAGFPSMVTMITGPSRTADIEKTLILGAHGPKEIYVFMIDDLPAVNGVEE
ncbi:MAG TPA: lactate utilization protein [Bacteroidia bacterium]|nr:lactate utilization protein [Bacteroidia bacterium]